MRHIRTIWLPALLATAALASACTDLSGPSDQSASSSGVSARSGSTTLLQTQTLKEGQGSNN